VNTRIQQAGAQHVEPHSQVVYLRASTQAQLWERMVARLEDQKKLLADPDFVRTVKRWERKESGEKVLVEKPLRSSRWWQPDQNGGYVMTVKIGSKRIEFEKGKAAIAIGSLEKLPAVIDALIKAVRAGELDEQLNQSAKSTRPLPSRKVA
jgi:hypothetical protein